MSDDKKSWLPYDEWRAQRNTERSAKGLPPVAAKSGRKSGAGASPTDLVALVAAALGARGAGVARKAKKADKPGKGKERVARPSSAQFPRAIPQPLKHSDTHAARSFEHNALLYGRTPPAVVPAPSGPAPHFPCVSGVFTANRTFSIPAGANLAFGVNPYCRAQLATATDVNEAFNLGTAGPTHVVDNSVANGTTTLSGITFGGGGLEGLSGHPLGGAWSSFVGGSYGVKISVPFGGACRVIHSMGERGRWGRPAGVLYDGTEDRGATLSQAGLVRYQSGGGSLGTLEGTPSTTVLGSQGVMEFQMPVPISQEFSWYKMTAQGDGTGQFGDEFMSGNLSDVIKAGQGIVWVSNTSASDAITVDFQGYLCYWASVLSNSIQSSLAVTHSKANDVAIHRDVKPTPGGRVNVQGSAGGLRTGMTTEQHHAAVKSGISTVLKNGAQLIEKHKLLAAGAGLTTSAGVQAIMAGGASEAVGAGAATAMTAAEAGITVTEVAELAGMLLLAPIGL